MNVTKGWYLRVAPGLEKLHPGCGSLANWPDAEGILPLTDVLGWQTNFSLCRDLWLQAVCDYVPFGMLFPIGTRLLKAVSDCYFEAAGASEEEPVLAAIKLHVATVHVRTGSEHLMTMVEDRHRVYSTPYQDRDNFTFGVISPLFDLPFVMMSADDQGRRKVLRQVCALAQEMNLGAVGTRPGNDFIVRLRPLEAGHRLKLWFVPLQDGPVLSGVSLSGKALVSDAGNGRQVGIGSGITDLRLLQVLFGLKPTMSGLEIEAALQNLVFSEA